MFSWKLRSNFVPRKMWEHFSMSWRTGRTLLHGVNLSFRYCGSGEHYQFLQRKFKKKPVFITTLHTLQTIITSETSECPTT
jgi:hypothetical protein